MTEWKAVTMVFDERRPSFVDNRGWVVALKKWGRWYVGTIIGPKGGAYRQADPVETIKLENLYGK